AVRAARRVAVGTVSDSIWPIRSGAPSAVRCTWQLISPGRTVRPSPSTTASPAVDGAWSAGPIQAMRRPSTTNAWAGTGGAPVPSTTVTSRSRKLGVLMRRSSPGRPVGGGQPRVERVAQPVAEQVERQDGEEDRDPGERGEVGGAEDELAALPEHRAPLRGRRLHAEPEEPEPG